MKLEERFLQAGQEGKEFRGAPFWSWNDDLSPKELRRQVRLMREAGLGGYFMHARVGLVTPYLGAKWMECIKAAVAEGKKLGMDSWLYDEDRWPSGTCGRTIPKKGPAYQAKRLAWTEATREDFKSRRPALATFVANRESGGLTGFRPVAPTRAKREAAKGQVIVQFYVEHDSNYVDLLEPKVVAAFIRSTYEAYKKRFAKEFGKGIPGIFTDEPNYHHVPWTEALPEYFRSRFGYELADSLPSICWPEGDWRRARHDFWCAVTELYVEAFSKQLYEWCEENGLAFTGHQLHEDSLSSQVRHVGAVMPHYEWMHVPGIDHLCRRITNPLLNKQVSSVANQMGGRRVLSESYGCAGWNMSFEDQKWIGDWQYVMGVNLLCQHLSLYSLRGCRKRDYPPSIFYQQPWWNDYPMLGDYFARLGAALTAGRHRADLLVLHPIGSAWALHDPGTDAPVERLNNALVRLSEGLLHLQRDFDYGDETILARHGEVEDGRLRVGACSYAAVIVPPSVTWRSSTVDLLSQFAGAGGILIFAGEPLPELVDAQPSSRIAEELLPRARRVANHHDALRGLLDGLVEADIRVRRTDGSLVPAIHCHSRDLGERKQLIFLANINNQHSVDTVITLRGHGRIEEWDPATGAIRPLPVELPEGRTVTRLSFPRAGSHLLYFDPRRKPLAKRAPVERVALRQALSNTWQIERTEPNALTLDYAAFQLGKAEWNPPTPTIWVNEQLLRAGQAGPLTLRYAFDASFDLSRPLAGNAKAPPCYLVMERPNKFRVTVNGKKIAYRPAAGWWTDIEFFKLDITSALKPGGNVIELATRYEPTKELGGGPGTPPPKMEIESVYLIGQFNVQQKRGRAPEGPPRFVVVPPTEVADVGDLGPQGLRFYRGAVIYRQTVEVERDSFDKVYLEFDQLDHILSKVRVNGKEAARLAWQPWRLDVTKLVKSGSNKFEVEVVGSCRNLLGPHHHVDGELFAVGPSAFTGRRYWSDSGDAPGTWTDDYSFVPFGITGPVTLAFCKARG